MDNPQPTGRREPLYLLRDPGDNAEAVKAATLAHRVGKPLMPFQCDIQDGILALHPDGTFVHPTCGAVAGRQSGKTLTAADLRILYGLFHRREKIVYTAQRWTTAKAIYLRLKRLISARPSLKARVPSQGGWICSQGVASITARFADGTESTALFITRSADFRGPDEIDLVIYDESYNLTDSELAAISPTQLASKNPQTIYLSSAVNQDNHQNGLALTRLRARALEAIAGGRTNTGIFYAEYGADEPSPDLTPDERKALREDPATWQQAIPSYGVIQTEAKVRKLLTELSPKDFEVEILGWGDWPNVDDATTVKVFNAGVWADSASTPRLTGATAVAVWRSIDRKRWAIAQAQRTTDGRVHIEIGPRRTGSHAEMAAYITGMIGSWNPVALGIDAKNCANVLQPLLIEAGVEPTMLNTPDIARGSGGFLDAVNDGLVSHSDQQILNDAIAAAVKRKLPGGDFAWTEDPAGIAGALIAASQAHELLLRFSTATPAKPPAAPSADTYAHDDHDYYDTHDELDAFAAF